MTSRRLAILDAMLARPGVRLATASVFAILVVASLSNLAIGVTFVFNFDGAPQGGFDKSGLDPALLPPPGDYSELLKKYQDSLPPDAGQGQGQGQGQGEGPGQGEPGQTPPPQGENPSGTPNSGNQPPSKIPPGAAEGIRPGAGDNSVPDMSGFDSPSGGFGDVFSGFGNPLSNPMDPKSFLILLGSVLGGIAAFVGIRRLLAWWRQRDEPKPAPLGPYRRLTPRAIPKDPRAAIIIAFETFVVEGRRRGIEMAEHETAREYAQRASGAGLGDAEDGRRLSELYDEARLSTHPIEPERRKSALQVLDRLLGAAAG
jgi:hypothetical protein